MQVKRIHGDELITFLKQNPNGDRDTLAVDAGYFHMRHGKPSVERSDFMQAIAEAHGTPVGPTITKRGNTKGKPLAYKIKVSPKGITPVGPGYTKQIGVLPGQFVTLYIEDGVIILEPSEKETAEETSTETA